MEDAMKTEIRTSWKGNMAFEANFDGHSVAMDAAVADGGGDTGVRPKGLLLAGLTGCTGMDVVSILKKMKEPCTWFELKVEAETGTEHPKKYTDIKLVFCFKKEDGLNEENVRKACHLSQEKYCGVAAMLRDSTKLNWEIAYL
jgi:putative redox protein